MTIYKVVSKGFCVEYTANKKSADAAFADSARDCQMFVVFPDGSAKLLQRK